MCTVAESSLCWQTRVHATGIHSHINLRIGSCSRVIELRFLTYICSLLKALLVARYCRDELYPYVMFLIRAFHYEGKWEGGWALEIETILGPVKWHRAVRQMSFGPKKVELPVAISP